MFAESTSVSLPLSQVVRGRPPGLLSSPGDLSLPAQNCPLSQILFFPPQTLFRP